MGAGIKLGFSAKAVTILNRVEPSLQLLGGFSNQPLVSRSAREQGCVLSIIPGGSVGTMVSAMVNMLSDELKHAMRLFLLEPSGFRSCGYG